MTKAKETSKKEAKKAEKAGKAEKVDKKYVPREMIVHKEDEKESERLRLERLK